MVMIEPEAVTAVGARRSASRSFALVLGVGALVFLVAFAGFALLRASGGIPAAIGADPHGPAPDFTLRTLDGKETITLSALRGEPVLLNFWASWCGTCEEEAPDLAEGWRRWKDRGVIFLGVDTRDSVRWAKEFLDRFGIEYRNVFDPTGSVERRYGVRAFPETFFIDADGNIRVKWMGPLDRERLDSFLEQLVRAA